VHKRPSESMLSNEPPTGKRSSLPGCGRHKAWARRETIIRTGIAKLSTQAARESLRRSACLARISSSVGHPLPAIPIPLVCHPAIVWQPSHSLTLKGFAIVDAGAHHAKNILHATGCQIKITCRRSNTSSDRVSQEKLMTTAQ
jgi:hypothetical protein